MYTCINKEKNVFNNPLLIKITVYDGAQMYNNLSLNETVRILVSTSPCRSMNILFLNSFLLALPAIEAIMG